MSTDVEIDVDIPFLPWQNEVFFGPTQKFIIVPKGRRPGATQGAMHASLEWLLNSQGPILWVDTVNANIDKYFELFMLPLLKQLPRDAWAWNVQKKRLHVYEQVMQFGSAESPESLEGFGYRKFILNEAGIILKNDYLYNNAILPMSIDYPDSQIFVLGVPKGIHKKDGNEHMFHILWQRAVNGDPKYWWPGYEITAYHNPLLSASDINELFDEIRTDQQRQQEIYGKFVDNAGDNPFAEAYNPDSHNDVNIAANIHKQLFISIDFNLNPFGVIFSHIWQDVTGLHFHTFDEKEIAKGSIPAMAKYIEENYRAYLHRCVITGDSGGNKGDLSQSDQASWFEQLRRALGLRQSQIVVPGVPFHETSRSDCNYILHESTKQNSKIDVKIHPIHAKGVCRDLANVQCNAFGEIVKRDRNDTNQRADLLDCWRYMVNTFLSRHIARHQKAHRPRR